MKYFLVLFFSFICAQNFYISPGFNITFNQNRDISFGSQIGVGLNYEIVHISTGIGAIYSLQNKQLRTYNFIGGGLTFLRFEYGNVKFKINSKSNKGNRMNILFGAPYANSELFHSLELSSLDHKKDIKQNNWIRFPIIIK